MLSTFAKGQCGYKKLWLLTLNVLNLNKICHSARLLDIFHSCHPNLKYSLAFDLTLSRLITHSWDVSLYRCN